MPQLARLAEDIITELQRKINGLRDSSETYDPSEANAILASNGLLSRQYDLSEECVSGSGVFSESGRNELLRIKLHYESSWCVHLLSLHIHDRSTRRFLLFGGYTSNCRRVRWQWKWGSCGND